MLAASQRRLLSTFLSKSDHCEKGAEWRMVLLSIGLPRPDRGSCANGAGLGWNPQQVQTVSGRYSRNTAISATSEKSLRIWRETGY